MVQQRGGDLVLGDRQEADEGRRARSSASGGRDRTRATPTSATDLATCDQHAAGASEPLHDKELHQDRDPDGCCRGQHCNSWHDSRSSDGALRVHERRAVNPQLCKLKAVLSETDDELSRRAAAASGAVTPQTASKAGSRKGDASAKYLEEQFLLLKTQLEESKLQRAAAVRTCSVTALERDQAREVASFATASSSEAVARAQRLEDELAGCRRELDRTAHVATLAQRREAHARGALSEIGELSSKRLGAAGHAASEEAVRHAKLSAELIATTTQLGELRALIHAHESTAEHFADSELSSARQIHELHERLGSIGDRLRATHREELAALRESLSLSARAREEELRRQLEEQQAEPRARHLDGRAVGEVTSNSATNTTRYGPALVIAPSSFHPGCRQQGVALNQHIARAAACGGPEGSSCAWCGARDGWDPQGAAKQAFGSRRGAATGGRGGCHSEAACDDRGTGSG